MKRTKTFVLAAGSSLALVASHASADVIVELRSGTTLHASRYWTEGDTVQLESYTGVIGLPRSVIASIAEDTSAPSTTASAKAAAASSRGTRASAPSAGGGGATTGTTGRDAAAGTTAAANPAPASPSAADDVPPSVDTDLAERPNEDLDAHMLRLDKLLIATHRELSDARYAQKSDADLARIQHRIDAINARRQETMRRQRAMR